MVSAKGNVYIYDRKCCHLKQFLQFCQQHDSTKISYWSYVFNECAYNILPTMFKILHSCQLDETLDCRWTRIFSAVGDVYAGHIFSPRSTPTATICSPTALIILCVDDLLMWSAMWCCQGNPFWQHFSSCVYACENLSSCLFFLLVICCFYSHLLHWYMRYLI